MTKYRLKDSNLQHHLDAISGGDFTDVLNANDLEFDEDGLTEIAFGSSAHGKTFIAEKFSVVLLKDEISFQYDPEAWNSFPEVMPPEDVLMRVETVGGDTFCGYFHTFPDGVGRWCCVCFTPRHMPLHETEKVKRYRPCE